MADGRVYLPFPVFGDGGAQKLHPAVGRVKATAEAHERLYCLVDAGLPVTAVDAPCWPGVATVLVEDILLRWTFSITC